MSEPKLEQIGMSVSLGGKVAIIKFDLSADYHVSGSRTYSIPEDWTNEQAEDFQVQEYERLREVVDKQSQVEYDDLWEQSYLS